jgi:hypothetical protein
VSTTAFECDSERRWTPHQRRKEAQTKKKFLQLQAFTFITRMPKEVHNPKVKIPHQDIAAMYVNPYATEQTLIDPSDLIHRQLLSRRILSPIQLLREDERKK